MLEAGLDLRGLRVGVIVSGGTLISRSISQPGFYSGVFPFMANRDWERNAALVRHLDEWRGRLRTYFNLIATFTLGRRAADGPTR